MLMICIAGGIAVIWALAAGYVLFFIHGLIRGMSAKRLLELSVSGIMTSKNVLINMMMIGMLTAVWRASGTIPAIVCYSARLIRPSAVILITFLLNCLISVLTGSSFASVATMGVISMTIAMSVGADPLLTGGAILSGIYFGDRCSPVSSSANLVCTVTDTNIYDNIRGMVRTSAVPFLISCAVYGLMGLSGGMGGDVPDMTGIYSQGFRIHWILVVPAAAILILSALRLNVKITMLVSMLVAAVLSVLIQKVTPAELVLVFLRGYRADSAELAAMLDGGGITSMLSVMAIIAVSSAYAGIFDGTGLLKGMKRYIAMLGRRITPFGSLAAVSALTCMISCNQTLATILTNQLCAELVPDNKKRAIDLENTAILIAPLIPWSIAVSVPLAAIGAPAASIPAACYLYLVPVWNFIVQAVGRKTSGRGIDPA